jgi:hypothetical protein
MSNIQEFQRRPQPDSEEERPQTHGASVSFWRSKYGVGAIVFLFIGGFFLLSEHRAHALGYLPFLLILLCPLMHIFMHGGHGHSGHRHDAGDQTDRRNQISKGD